MIYLVIGVFLLILSLVLLAVGLGVRFDSGQRKSKRAGMLVDAESQPLLSQPSVLIDRGGDDGQIDQLLSRLQISKRCESQIRQAGLTWTLPQMVLFMLTLGAIGALLGVRVRLLIDPVFSALGVGCLFATLPWFYVRATRKKRLAQIEEQFPEALDFMARALRAGHAFQISLSMLSQESPEPLRTEFLKVYNEQNLGEALPLVLRHLADRVPLVDVRFFVAAILMQRETGGNLGEILTKLSSVIRDRFRLRGQVKAASAHGRITATILTVLPIITMILLSMLAPGYLPAMAKDPDGKHLIEAAIVGQLIGYLIMRKIIDIKV